MKQYILMKNTPHVVSILKFGHPDEKCQKIIYNLVEANMRKITTGNKN